jgi:hypothetical protein
VPHGEALARDRQAHHDLRRITAPVLGQTALARRAVGLGPGSPAAVHGVFGPAAFVVQAQATRLGLSAAHLVDAQALPQRLQHVDLAVGPRAHQTPIAVGCADDLLGRATAQDAGGELAQALDKGRIVGASLLGLAQVHVPQRRQFCRRKARAQRQSVYPGHWRRSTSPNLVKSTTFATQACQNRAYVPRNRQSQV